MVGADVVYISCLRWTQWHFNLLDMSIMSVGPLCAALISEHHLFHRLPDKYVRVSPHEERGELVGLTTCAERAG